MSYVHKIASVDSVRKIVIHQSEVERPSGLIVPRTIGFCAISSMEQSFTELDIVIPTSMDVAMFGGKMPVVDPDLVDINDLDYTDHICDNLATFQSDGVEIIKATIASLRPPYYIEMQIQDDDDSSLSPQEFDAVKAIFMQINKYSQDQNSGRSTDNLGGAATAGLADLHTGMYL